MYRLFSDEKDLLVNIAFNTLDVLILPVEQLLIRDQKGARRQAGRVQIWLPIERQPVSISKARPVPRL